MHPFWPRCAAIILPLHFTNESDKIDIVFKGLFTAPGPFCTGILSSVHTVHSFGAAINHTRDEPHFVAGDCFSGAWLRGAVRKAPSLDGLIDSPVLAANRTAHRIRKPYKKR